MSSLADVLQQGMAFHQAGRLDEAEPCYQRVLAAIPGQPDASHFLAALYLQSGRPALAVAPLRAVLAARPDHAEAINNLRVALAATGQLAQAADLFQDMAGRQPDSSPVLTALAATLCQLGRHAAAIPVYQRLIGPDPSLRMDPSPEMPSPVKIDLLAGFATCLEGVGRLDDAAAILARAAALAPDRADLQASLAGILIRLDRVEDALPALRQAAALADQQAIHHYNLAHALQRMGRLHEAQAAYEHALARDPAMIDAAYNLANIVAERQDPLLAAERYQAVLALDPGHQDARVGAARALAQAGRWDRSADFFEQAIAAAPDDAGLLTEYAILLGKLGKAGQALPLLAKALELSPDLVPALSVMGCALDTVGRHDEAALFHDKAVDLAPDNADTANNAGLHYMVTGQGAKAAALFRQSLALMPGNEGAHSNLIFALDFDADVDIAAAQAERRRWYAAHGCDRGLPVPTLTWDDVDRDPERRLTIGYVSADFRHHSAAYCFAPVVTGHDRTRFRVLCYSNNPVEDDMTARLRAGVDGWRDIAGAGDADVHRRIRGDGVDILVDLSGHTGGNRLTLFAGKPAPIQISAWGHITGTGVPAIDALLADPEMVRPEERPLFAERVVDLPCALILETPADAPPVAPPPVLSAGRITFGCLNRLSKVTDGTLALWARILATVPGSRLLFKDRVLDNPAARADLLRRLDRLGVPGDRVELLGGSSRAEHLAAYGRVDIVLDPTPYSGGITSCEAIWMGAPVITLAGTTLASRITASILRACGMDELITRTADDYVALAVRLAADPVALSASRAVQRERVGRMPVFDSSRYTAAVETVYRDLWREWCRKG